MCQKQALPQRKYQYDACNGEEFDKHHNLALKSPIIQPTHLIHVIWFGSSCIPPIVEYENIWFRQPLRHFVEKVFLLQIKQKLGNCMIVLEFWISPWPSEWTRRWPPVRTHLHPGSVCRSTRRGWEWRRCRANRPARRHPAKADTFLWARKCEPFGSPSTFPYITRGPVVPQTENTTFIKSRLKKIEHTCTLTFCFSVESSVTRYASPVSEPSTCRKQFVVWPMPLGRILSRNMALITVLLPLLVLGNTR